MSFQIKVHETCTVALKMEDHSKIKPFVWKVYIKECLLLQFTIKLLQIASALLITNYGSFFITNYDKVLPNCDRYYKLSNKLLEFMKAITNSDRTLSSW